MTKDTKHEITLILETENHVTLRRLFTQFQKENNGDRFDVYEILQDSRHKGSWLPAIEPEKRAVAEFRVHWWTMALYTEAIKVKKLIECRKVAALVIKKVK